MKCDYCYVYEHADQGWRRQPSLMDPAVVRTVARRIADHAERHRLPAVRVVLHGGEPLLAGAARLDEIATELHGTIGPRLDLRMQTNGVLLTEEICAVLRAHRIRVGVSLDGDVTAHDRHRRFAHGAGSHRHVRRALALLRADENRDCYAGLLCTVDLRNDPIAVYRALLAESPPRIDFLLPHATWETPPPAGPTSYGRWLSAIFAVWTEDGRRVPIRLFDALLAPGEARTEAVGLGPADLVVIETDGSYEQVDSLKVTYDGAAATGLDVFTATVNEVAAHPMIAMRQTGLAGLSATCRACPVVDRCGGGQFTHRFRSSNGFDNPSVYCADLQELIGFIVDRDGLAGWVRDELASGAGGAAAVGQLPPIHEAITRARVVTLGSGGADGWAELVALDEAAPDAVREVLTHPFVRRGDVAYLKNVAVSAAIRAGAEIELAVESRDGLLFLPTLGALRRPGTGTVRTFAGGFRAGDVTVRLAEPPPAWLPTRRLAIGFGIEVVLEDSDPLRGSGLALAGRLDDAAAAAWQQRLEGALAGLNADAPDYLPGIAAALRAIVPLAPDGTGKQRAGSARTAFGAVAATPEEPDALALLLVHEVQHLKLGAILDVCPLFDPRDPTRIAVRWRADPRPVEGVLQGSYAFLAVADVWRRRGDGGRYAEIRGWLDAALDALLAGSFLTPAGVRFVTGMRATVDDWSI
ncbi:FxsB family cyclophane-forming radical SAM/SPASM peptide maturase [Actinoplanes oblitus]|uniref:FxsB family cyclophane-forming radical SAM/SPASM peptide maturase n=1 Tax=Actinoplanes oblitus TaxID=3040509 RepID=A0ABY8WVK3_9ACTN|nr:FxsB family cyclophane-forming radical SAM/SPASM peptide maturase [Actinoplanes oblitus]WIN00859.1 FxsB family cyclophane-forming radical SAM/SPASM peptide maturase [Actinoplanes oblitus]